MESTVYSELNIQVGGGQFRERHILREKERKRERERERERERGRYCWSGEFRKFNKLPKIFFYEITFIFSTYSNIMAENGKSIAY